jgi:general stress protein 26
MTENKQMNESELKIFSINLIENAKICYFTTINGEGFPVTRAIFNLRYLQQFPNLADIFKGHDQDFMIYIATNTSSEKIEHIKGNRKVNAYYCDVEGFKGVMLSGNIEIINDIEIKKALWQDNWSFYYSEGSSDYTDPDYYVMRLYPNKLHCWFRGNYKISLK